MELCSTLGLSLWHVLHHHGHRGSESAFVQEDNEEQHCDESQQSQKGMSNSVQFIHSRVEHLVLGSYCVRLNWYPIPYIVRYLWPGLWQNQADTYRLLSEVYIKKENLIQICLENFKFGEKGSTQCAGFLILLKNMQSKRKHQMELEINKKCVLCCLILPLVSPHQTEH